MQPKVLASSLFVILMGSQFALPQSASPTQSQDGLELLKQAALQYANAKSYYIQSIEERSSTGEYEQSLQKTVLVVAEAPGDRYYYEGRSPTGSALKVSNGNKVWSYRIDEKRYTESAVQSGTASAHEMIAMTEMARSRAQYLRKELGHMANSYKSAERLPDENLKIDGKNVSCAVVRVRDSDAKRVSGGYTFDKTIWIDKSTKTVRRVREQMHTFLNSGSARIPLEQLVTTNYTVTELDAPIRESLFTFTPPPGAKLVADFPDPIESFGMINLAGDQVPSLKLKSSDGKIVPIESFRGKPLLIDFWATWCAPCVASLPQVAQIYKEAGEKGLILIAVDQDEEPNTAAEFLSKKGYTWPTYHDGDGQIEKMMGSSGVPRVVLVDAQGQIVLDSTGASEDRIRTAIAKLGPEYESLKPKPKTPQPCVAKN
jgi:thiol-disulfide isomerase/thioredoxin